MPLVSITCETCGKQFFRRACKDGAMRFCSAACGHAAQFAAPNLTCAGCGKAFHRPPSYVARCESAPYCTSACRLAACRVEVTCHACRKPFTITRRRAQRNSRHFCSDTCRRPVPNELTPNETRFWAKVRKAGPDECWEWTGSRYVSGHGQFCKRDGDLRLVRAHVFSWEIAVGPVPAGMEVCHQCDNPPCVNPAHLFPGTHAENMADMVAKGRSARGERSGMSKLTDSEVLEIRRLAATGMRRRLIAAQFAVSVETVYRAISRKQWGHLD